MTIDLEIRVPDAIGSVSIFTPLNRFYYGQGEAIPVSIVVRNKPGSKRLDSIRVKLGEYEMQLVKVRAALIGLES